MKAPAAFDWNGSRVLIVSFIVAAIGVKVRLKLPGRDVLREQPALGGDHSNGLGAMKLSPSSVL